MAMLLIAEPLWTTARSSNRWTINVDDGWDRRATGLRMNSYREGAHGGRRCAGARSLQARL